MGIGLPGALGPSSVTVSLIWSCGRSKERPWKLDVARSITCLCCSSTRSAELHNQIENRKETLCALLISASVMEPYQ